MTVARTPPDKRYHGKGRREAYVAAWGTPAMAALADLLDGDAPFRGADQPEMQCDVAPNPPRQKPTITSPRRTPSLAQGGRAGEKAAHGGPTLAALKAMGVPYRGTDSARDLARTAPHRALSGAGRAGDGAAMMKPGLDPDASDAVDALVCAYLARNGSLGHTSAMMQWLQLAAMAAHGRVSADELAELTALCLANAPALLEAAERQQRQNLEDEAEADE